MESTTTTEISSSTWFFNSTTDTSTPEASTSIPTSKFCYPIDLNSSDDTLVKIFFVLFFVLCLTGMIWRIISGIQMLRRYQSKIRILTSGPILDASYFENEPSYATKAEQQKQQSPTTPLLNDAPK